MSNTLHYTTDDKIVWIIDNVATDEYDESDDSSIEAGSSSSFTATIRHFNLNDIYNLGLFLNPSNSSNKLLEWAENERGVGLSVTCNGITRYFRQGTGSSRTDILWLFTKSSQKKITLAPQVPLSLTFTITVPVYEKNAYYFDVDVSLFYRIKGSAV